MFSAQSLWTNADLIAVGKKIWKSSDCETYMMNVDHIKPTAELILFRIWLLFGFPKMITNTTVQLCYGGIARNFDDEKPIHKLTT